MRMVDVHCIMREREWYCDGTLRGGYQVDGIVNGCWQYLDARGKTSLCI